MVGRRSGVPSRANPGKPAGDTTWLSVQTGAAGPYVIGASLSPRQIALSAEAFNGYLKEDGIPDVLDARTRAGELDARRASAISSTSKPFSKSVICERGAFEFVLGYPGRSCRFTNSYLRLWAIRSRSAVS